MSDDRLTAEDGNYAVATEGGTLTVEIVGRRPENTPYVWIGKDGEHLDTLDEDVMAELADALNDALGRSPSGE